MSDNNFELSRRKVLGGLTTIGVAGAAAGFGTSAYFSDRETFEDNSLVAGSLDLKVDWEEHYYDGSAEGAEMAPDPADADYVLPALKPLTEPAVLRNGEYRDDAPVGSLQVSSPDDALPIALNFTGDGTTQENKDAFWDATAIEAFPDPDDNGIQGDQSEGSEFAYAPCEMGADTPEDLDPRESLRTENDDTIGVADNGDEEEPYPLVYLEDVKPGDFGELTLSFHLCDNPGYVWLQGELLANAENGVTEPEAKDPDEDDGNGVADPDAGDDMSGELADHVLTRLWYDGDCDNQVDEETGELDMMIAVDASGSIEGGDQDRMRDGVNEFINELPDDGSVRVGTLTFGDNEINNLQGLGAPNNISVSLPSFGGNTPLPAAIDIADQVVRNDPNARSGAQKTVVVFTDGGPNYQNESYATGDYTAPRDDSTDWSAASGNSAYDNADAPSGTVSKGEMDETALVAESVRDMTTRIATVFVGGENSQNAMTEAAVDAYDTLPNYLATEIGSPGFNFTVDFADLTDLATQLQETIVVGEEVFFLGTLGQALRRLEQGNGIPLDGDLGTAFNELADPDDDADRECFPAESTHCIGMEWWLPLNHANQIQTDGVAFDLGFYTEQCRHNDGAGMPPETTPNGNETNGNTTNGNVTNQSAD
ncbi:M73 family secreted endopeptidase [Halapricum desulfuricans]|uniref:M73 family secreted endopeptidase n=1 Tax=Halapricum desulfuricans TaxID=2841257 RepID=A0A897NLH4_9EURY|nr:vWA domain-containing protein [Halapricum desulfuricans]QSG11729.1 M73 family secreted endopeptidase [Halapricum desulfuricans]